MFTKPAIDIDAQIDLLRSRGLTIADENRARHYLRHIGYYRLSGYALVFQVNYNADGSHRFHPGANLDDVLDLYIFDRKLRLAVLDALERIEVAVRSVLSHEMSLSQGTHWFMDAAHFVPTYAHDSFLAHVKKEIGHDPAKAHARQVFIQHYYKKYGDPELPPSWMVFEVLSFGSVSQVFKNLKRENQKPIGKVFGLDGGVLASWLHAISYLRNLVAHHQRLWNRSFTIKPTPAKRYAEDLKDPSRFYAQAVMVQALLKTIAPDSQWSHRLAQLMAEHPKVPSHRMGFPIDWQTREIWLP